MLANTELFTDYTKLIRIRFDAAEQEHQVESLAQELYDSYIEEADVTMLAALIMILNHKCWDFFNAKDEATSRKYADLYYVYNEKAWDWLEKNDTEEEKTWFFETLDQYGYKILFSWHISCSRAR